MIFKFSIGGYNSGGFELEFKNNSLCCYQSEYPGLESLEPKYRFSVKGDGDWARLISYIHKLKWKASYWENACDGTQWKIKFNDRGFKFKSEGSNAYPPEFDAFMGILAKLLKKHGVPFQN